MDDAPTEINRQKIRLGLAIVSVVFIGCVAGFFLIKDTIGQAVMVGVAVVAIVRLGLLARSLRRESRAA